MSSSKSIKTENRESYTELAFNIAYYRKRANLTQEELAEKIGISRAHLGAIEAPNVMKPFSLEILFDIARALEVEPYRLFMPK